MPARLAKLPIVVIVGPTSSGKSALAVEVAKKFKGEVIPADSRQVYRQLDLGTGKITKKEMRGVPHHMLDVSSPRRTLTVAGYRKKALSVLEDIIRRGKLPIICGGTGLYIEALTDNIVIPSAPIDRKLRKDLEKKSIDELLEMLATKDPERLETIERHHKRRIIRAIEIATHLGKVPKQKASPDPRFEFIFIGINPLSNESDLKSKITKRLDDRLRKGLVAETRRLREDLRLSKHRLENFGIEYRHTSRFIDGEIDKQQMRDEIVRDSLRYAKRQMKWFKRNDRIKWFGPNDQDRILNDLERFLS